MLPALALALWIASADSAASAPAPLPSFDSLRQAVEFIGQCLSERDIHRLEAATKYGYISDVEYVRRLNNRYPLTKLYAGKEFPDDGTRFSLGGHGSELGHTTILFVKREGRWIISSISNCR
jgi:hypothetical protein